MSTRLGHFATFKGGSAFPLESQGISTGVIPFMKVSDLSRGTGRWKSNDAANWLSGEAISSLRPTVAPAGSTVFAKIGEGLRSERCRFLTGPSAIDNNMMAAIPTEFADDRFLYYLFHTVGLSTYAVGSALPYLKQSTLQQIPVEVPPLPTQRAIAEVLGALDDKIAANTKLAATADEYIRANLANLTADIDDVITIGQLATNRKDLRDPNSLDPNANYVGLEHIPRRSMWLDAVGMAESVTSTKAGFQPGDVLFGKLRPYFHKVVAAPFAGICSTDILVVTSIHKYLAEFVLASIASDYVVERVTAASEGTRMPRTSWKALAAIEIGWPGEEKAREFSASVSALRRSIESLIRENVKLAATRDALLPQLMSGKLRVKDAEALVSFAV